MVEVCVEAGLFGDRQGVIKPGSYASWLVALSSPPISFSTQARQPKVETLSVHPRLHCGKNNLKLFLNF